MSSCRTETEAASHTHTDRSMYLKEAEISNYRSGSQGDRRDRLSKKWVAMETRPKKKQQKKKIKETLIIL